MNLGLIVRIPASAIYPQEYAIEDFYRNKYLPKRFTAQEDAIAYAEQNGYKAKIAPEVVTQ